MHLPDQQRFVLPSNLTSSSEKISFCLSVINKYRNELPALRLINNTLKRQKQKAVDETEYWKQKYEQEKKEKDQLKKEKDLLILEIAKFTKTINRYRVSLFDHGNYKSPNALLKKSKGGQIGHLDTNKERRESVEDFTHQRIFASSCPDCGQILPRVNGIRSKKLLDVVINPAAIKTIIESEKQWCNHCKKEVNASSDLSLPFTEYGVNVLMVILLFKYRCQLSVAKVSLLLKISYGLEISKSGITNLLSTAQKYLSHKYDQLKQSVRDGDLMYADETGWQVKGKNVWMWIMANDQTTVYVAAESRGHGIAKDMYGNSQAFTMHDGFKSYDQAIPKNKTLFCWSHLLRFCFEETVHKKINSLSVKIRDKLVNVYHLKKQSEFQTDLKRLEVEASARIQEILNIKTKDPTAQAILHRLRQQSEGLIRALIVSPNGTNNLAEQELRDMAISRKISYGSDTFTGMETTAILASIVRTLTRSNSNNYFQTLATDLREGLLHCVRNDTAVVNS